MYKLVTPNYKLEKNEFGVEMTSSVKSACELALELPQKDLEKTCFVTAHVDSDSAFAIAILELRKKSSLFDKGLAMKIGLYDSKGPRSVRFTPRLYRTFKIVRGIHEKHRYNLQKKLKVMVNAAIALLLHKKLKVFAEYCRYVDQLRKNQKYQKIAVTKINRNIIYVESLNFGALGYCYDRFHAQIVIAFNPRFFGRYNKFMRKFTIARRDEKVKIDMQGLLKYLNKLEPGWGGHVNIIGSPHFGTHLTSQQVIDTVLKFA